MLSLIDIHAHLTFKSFRKDVEDVITRAKQSGVIAIIDSTIDPGDFLKGLQLHQRYPNYIYLAIGAAPQAINREMFEETLLNIEKYVDLAVAVGEIGLDYYWIRDKDMQLETVKMFKELVAVAISKKKPIVIHNRDATDDIMRILNELDPEKVVFHAFMGETYDALRIIKNGWYISIPTILARSNKHKRLIRVIDLDHIMLETDSPFLSPQPRTRNEPANVKVSAEIISQIKKIPYDEVCYITTKNAINFFKLPINIGT